MSTINPRALFTITCYMVACFSQCCWCKSNTSNFNFVPQVLQCSWFSGAHSVLQIAPQVNPSGVKSGDRGGYSTLLYVLSIFSLCRMWWTVALQTPASREHCHSGFLEIVWRPVTLSQRFQRPVNCEAFRAFLVHFLHCSISLNLPRNSLTVTNVGGGVPNSFISPTSLHFIHVLLFQ
jgi:hypothetical protein